MLIVTTNPPADFEEELNAWYDTDHIAERLAVPGFETGRRYAMSNIARRYLALYDMRNVDVLQSPAYLAVSGDNVTPWTRRVINRGRFGRYPTVQIYPGDALTTLASRLLFLGFSGVDRALAQSVIASAERNFPKGAHVRQLRVFASVEGDRTADFFVIVEGHGALDTLFDPVAFGVLGDHLDVVSLYLPY
ncbi:DUF4286 family protein [Mesorhizobium sp. B3-1-6]|uniref:DUF4286 family protein n=1 Tax=Mesorhizobium sp. B3-1-6 TaxID=2589895 RepID=UPI0015E4088F|nr:DUF4286 family protein [Mesorhizobium sp. B3-1-6]